MKATLLSIWKWVKWPVLVLVFLYCVLVGWRVFYLFEEEKTADAVAAIHAQKITLADVTGENLPPIPDQAENDATVAGIDVNNNGIRDDVELAIFKKYNNVQSRAAALQYAMSEQRYLTHVFDTPTWKAVAEETGRAGRCLFDVEVDWEEIVNLISNTSLRKEARTNAFKYITSYGPAEGAPCDVSFN